MRLEMIVLFFLLFVAAAWACPVPTIGQNVLSSWSPLRWLGLASLRWLDSSIYSWSDRTPRCRFSLELRLRLSTNRG